MEQTLGRFRQEATQESDAGDQRPRALEHDEGDEADLVGRDPGQDRAGQVHDEVDRAIRAHDPQEIERERGQQNRHTNGADEGGIHGAINGREQPALEHVVKGPNRGTGIEPPCLPIIIGQAGRRQLLEEATPPPPCFRQRVPWNAEARRVSSRPKRQ